MKTEFLKGLGLSDEDIQKILAENGKDVEREKAKTGDVLAEVESLKKEKQTLTDKVTELSDNATSAEDYKKQLEDLKNEIKEREAADKRALEDAQLTDAITAVFGDKKFTSDYVKNGIIADMKTEVAKPENKGKGYAELFEALTKDKDGIFANPNPGIEIPGMGNFDENLSENSMRAVMGLGPTKE